jgi:hypothetical protein
MGTTLTKEGDKFADHLSDVILVKGQDMIQAFIPNTAEKALPLAFALIVT